MSPSSAYGVVPDDSERRNDVNNDAKLDTSY